MSTVDANYRAKVAARANGTTPVLARHANPADIKGQDPATVDARFRAKLAARNEPEKPLTKAQLTAAQIGVGQDAELERLQADQDPKTVKANVDKADAEKHAADQQAADEHAAAEKLAHEKAEAEIKAKQRR